MVVVSQKERYRRQAALCYRTAATLSGERAASMIRLGDTYAALAVDPERLLPNMLTSAKNRDARCRRCGKKMRLTHSLPRTKLMPPMQAFRCDNCGETLIWKGDASPGPQERRTAPVAGDRWMTRYVALAFRKARGGFAPGPAVECPDAELAIERAQLMIQEPDIAGAVAFSRRMDTATEEFEPAVILRTFGSIPKNFDIA